MRPLRTFAVCATALAASSLPLVLSCAPGSPCHSADTRRQLDRFSHPYAGHWVITHGDSLTIPDPTLGDRFRITDLVLGTDTASIGTQCLYRGTMVFAVPKAETLTVSWFGVPEHVTVFGWPAELGPFAGVNAQWWDVIPCAARFSTTSAWACRPAPGLRRSSGPDGANAPTRRAGSPPGSAGARGNRPTTDRGR